MSCDFCFKQSTKGRGFIMFLIPTSHHLGWSVIVSDAGPRLESSDSREANILHCAETIPNNDFIFLQAH